MSILCLSATDSDNTRKCDLDGLRAPEVRVKGSCYSANPVGSWIMARTRVRGNITNNNIWTVQDAAIHHRCRFNSYGIRR